MQPALNISQTLSYLMASFFNRATSGATYPGVPHFGNGY